MIYKVRLGKKEIIVKTYSTQEELNILEFLFCDEESFDDDEKYEIVLDDFLRKLINYNVKKLTQVEKILLVWKIRELTLGSDISIFCNCTKCKKPFDTFIRITDLFKNKENDLNEDENFYSEEYIDNLTLEEYYENYEDFDLDEYQEKKENFRDSFNKFKERFRFNCTYCKNTMSTDLVNFKSCLKFLSEDTFESLTFNLHRLVYQGNHTRNDVLKMSPIQRMLELKYLDKTIEKEQRV